MKLIAQLLDYYRFVLGQFCCHRIKLHKLTVLLIGEVYFIDFGCEVEACILNFGYLLGVSLKQSLVQEKALKVRH